MEIDVLLLMHSLYIYSSTNIYNKKLVRRSDHTFFNVKKLSFKGPLLL